MSVSRLTEGKEGLMKFSVIVPVYNVEKYLSKCIDSVLNQAYQEKEIVLVDDGSTDRSGSICDDYSAHYPSEVKVIHTTNQGQSIARSCGIDHSDGDFLLFVDADDYIRSDALELLSCQFENTAADLVMFNASQDEDFAISYPGFDFTDGQQFAGKAKKCLFEMLITTTKLNPLWLKAMKRELAQSICEEYRHFQLKHAEDLLYTLPILSAAQNIVYMDQNLYYWRTREDSIVHSYNPERHRSIKKVHLEMEKYIDEWQMEALHPVHYAREVRGWVECLKMIMRNAGRNSKVLMCELAEDGYFRRAYQNMDGSTLSKKDVILASLLYKKRFGILKTVTIVAKAVKGKRER